jgi:hypothetical protein
VEEDDSDDEFGVDAATQQAMLDDDGRPSDDSLGSCRVFM